MSDTSVVPDVSTCACVCVCVRARVRMHVPVGRRGWGLYWGEVTATPQESPHSRIGVLNVVPHPGPLRLCRLCIIDDLHLQRCVLYRCKCYYSFYILCSCWKIILSLNNMAVQFFLEGRGLSLKENMKWILHIIYFLKVIWNFRVWDWGWLIHCHDEI